MTQPLLQMDVERKPTWLESAVSQYPLVAPQLPLEITSSHIHQAMGKPSRKSDCASLFRKLQAAGFIRFERYEKSDRPERRGGVTGVWRKVEL